MLAPHAPVDWQKLLAFLGDRKPGLPEKIRGVSQDELEALRRRSPVPLPENYVGFLRHFGGADGGFRVFPRHHYLAAELLREGPQEPAGWDPDRHLLIGLMESKECEDPHDLFLELSRGDATDAPLVGMDLDPEEPSTQGFPLAHSLADRLILLAWRPVNRPKPAKARLVGFCNPAPGNTEVLQRYRALVAVAERLGFTPCVSATANTWMGRQGRETFALVYNALSDTVVSMELRGDDAAPIAQVREVVEDLGLAEPTRVLPD